MGGSAAAHNNFWQVFVRPGQAGTWKLATPLGVASNGGITVAAEGGARPGRRDPAQPGPVLLAAGQQRRQRGQVGPVRPAGRPARRIPGRAGGRARRRADRADQGRRRRAQGAPGGVLDQAGQRARGGRGRRPRLPGPPSSPRSPTARRAPRWLAGACSRAGEAGIFRLAGGHWSRTGPALPAALARRSGYGSADGRRRPRGRRAAGRGARDGRAPAGGLVQSGRHLVGACPSRTSSARRARCRRRPASGSLGVLLSGGRAVSVSGPGAAWRSLPALPARVSVGPWRRGYPGRPPAAASRP